ncbi:MAG: ribonuclease HII [Deferribacteraceae bacterium]|jgi:ribonuclease HII|nr:ribonuclease HII [Deferribacteraceae bacterium]
MIVSYNNLRICGVDEVGRGCLAGPVAAAAVVLPKDYFNGEVRDSKRLNPKKRALIAADIHRNALSIGIGLVCNIIIDKIGILPSTKQAMHLAIARISVPYDLIIIDAISLNNLSTPHIHPFKADDTYFEAACASIVAKVYRDSLMEQLDEIYPEYGFASHKGYGTVAHCKVLKDNGITPLHRRSFLKNRDNESV